MGHGGGQDGVVARAHHYAANGFAAVDAPGHGDRPDLGALVARFTLVLAEQAVPEWRSVLDGLLKLDGIGGGVGYCGLSLLATEPHVTAGVLALFGLFGLAEVAGRVTVPVEFVLQWDDPMVARDRGLALFDALGSVEKTLHVNPGGHGACPPSRWTARPASSPAT